MLSFFMPSSLPILSWAKAAGACANVRASAAADIRSAIRVMEVMGRSFESGFESDECRYVQDGRAMAFVTGRMKFFGETTSGLIPQSSASTSATQQCGGRSGLNLELSD
jgi:hypothetical protein